MPVEMAEVLPWRLDAHRRRGATPDDCGSSFIVDLLGRRRPVRRSACPFRCQKGRVSTSGQLLDRQQRALAEVGCLRVFADKPSGKNAD